VRARAELRLTASLALLVLLSPAIEAPIARAADGPGFHLEPVAAGYKRPTYVTSSADPLRLYVVEQAGVIRVLRRDAVRERTPIPRTQVGRSRAPLRGPLRRWSSTHMQTGTAP
jgi:hypothetical protein